MLTLKIETDNEVLKELYGLHKYDNTVDLYIAKDIIIPPYVLGYEIPCQLN